jgi:hypothetical protein
MLENLATLLMMNDARRTMQKIREKFLPFASMGPNGVTIPVNGYEAASKPNWGSKTA